MKSIFLALMVLLTSTAHAQEQNKAVVITLWDASVTWKGPWVSDIAYSEGDMIQFDGSSYMALVSHTSSVNNVPPDVETWDLVAAEGTDGMDAINGNDGAPGADGIPGTDGDDGDSAYQVWLNAGNSGSEQDYLDSLVGPAGPQGEQGQQGEQGDPWIIYDDLRIAMCHSFHATGAPVPVDFCSDKIVFVTSETYSGNLGGLVGADSLCQSLADLSELAPAGTYLAWLSTIDTSGNHTTPLTRFIQHPMAYKNVNGGIVDLSWDELTDNELIGAINVDQNGRTQGNRAWTQTSASGTLGGPGVASSACDNWTNGASGIAAVGYVGNTDSSWSRSNYRALCTENNHLYCFQQ